jgi:hypothetical protein
MLKFSYITPIFKKGDRKIIINYRPISKISLIAKIFSKVITLKITPLFKNVLVDEQHGFRNGKSTVTNLAIFK